MRNLQSCAATMRTLRDCRLYGIIDLGYIPRVRDCSRIAEQMVTGGVDLIQLRGKGKSIDELINLAGLSQTLPASKVTNLVAMGSSGMQGSQSVVYLSDQNAALWQDMAQDGYIMQKAIPAAAQPDPN